MAKRTEYFCLVLVLGKMPVKTENKPSESLPEHESNEMKNFNGMDATK